MSARLHLTHASAPVVNWEVVYRETMPRIYNFFRYRVGDDQLAEDLTATTFMRAWRARDRYATDVAAFSTWLFSIAQNLAIDYFRQKKAEVALDDLADLPDDNPLEDLVQRHIDSARLNALLAQLTPRERELLALKYGAELTNRAIAGLVNMSESNVGTTLHRIIVRLRQQWDNAP